MCVGSWFSLTGKPKRFLKLQRGNLFRVKGKAANGRFALSPGCLKQCARYSGQSAATALPAMTNIPTKHANTVFYTAPIACITSPLQARRDGSVNTSREVTAQKLDRHLESCERDHFDLDRLLSYGNAT